MERRYKVRGTVWSHHAPLSYVDVMREASDNELVTEPTQPAAEHSGSLPAVLLALIPPIADPFDRDGLGSYDTDELDAIAEATREDEDDAA